MDSVLNAVRVVITIFIVMGLGMFLTKLGWIDRKISGFISKFVIRIALPATIISKIFGEFTKEKLIGMAVGLSIPVTGLLVSIVVSILVVRFLKLPKGRRGSFTTMFTLSNSIFVGLPVCTSLFGDDVVPYTLLYYIANTTIFWTIGYALIRRDGDMPKDVRSYKMIPSYLFSRDKKNERFLPARNAMKMLSKTIPVPLVTLIISASCVLLGISLPSSVMDASKYVGNTVTPLSLVYIGFLLMRMIEERKFRWEKGYLAIIIGKFILVPFIMIALIKLFSLNAYMSENVLNDIMIGAIVMQAAMPIMTQTSIVVGECGGDDEYTAGATALTTALCLVFIPFYMYIITYVL